MVDDLLKLAERAESATVEQQHEVMAAVYESGIFTAYDKATLFLRFVGAGAYLDAAMSLVPDGWRTCARDSDEWRCICILERDSDDYEVGVQAATWPLALTAAALRSIASLRSEKDNG